MRQVLRAGALGRPRGMGWGGRQEGSSGWGTHVNSWLIYTMEYCSAIKKNTFESVLMRWMKLSSILTFSNESHFLVCI